MPASRSVRVARRPTKYSYPTNLPDIMKKPRIYAISFAKAYPLYIAKAETKGRTKAEVDELIRWRTGCSQTQLQGHRRAGKG